MSEKPPDMSEMTEFNKTEGLLQSCWCIGWAGGQDLRCEEKLPWGQMKLASTSPFQDYPVILGTFITESITLSPVLLLVNNCKGRLYPSGLLVCTTWVSWAGCLSWLAVIWVSGICKMSSVAEAAAESVELRSSTGAWGSRGCRGLQVLSSVLLCIPFKSLTA